MRGKSRRIQAVADELQDFVDAGFDDPRERRAGNLVWQFVLVGVEGRHGKHFAFIGKTGKRAAEHCLQPLCIFNAGGQPTGDIGGHVLAADGNRIDMYEMTAAVDGDRRGPAAEINDRAAEFRFVVDED